MSDMESDDAARQVLYELAIELNPRAVEDGADFADAIREAALGVAGDEEVGTPVAPPASPGEQGARVWTICVCPECGSLAPEQNRCRVEEPLHDYRRVPVEVVPRQVSPEAVEAVRRELARGSYQMPAEELPYADKARAVLTAAGLLVSGAVTEEENADG